MNINRIKMVTTAAFFCLNTAIVQCAVDGADRAELLKRYEMLKILADEKRAEPIEKQVWNAASQINPNEKSVLALACLPSQCASNYDSEQIHLVFDNNPTVICIDKWLGNGIDSDYDNPRLISGDITDNVLLDTMNAYMEHTFDLITIDMGAAHHISWDANCITKLSSLLKDEGRILINAVYHHSTILAEEPSEQRTIDESVKILNESYLNTQMPKLPRVFFYEKDAFGYLQYKVLTKNGSTCFPVFDLDMPTYQEGADVVFVDCMNQWIEQNAIPGTFELIEGSFPYWSPYVKQFSDTAQSFEFKPRR